MKASKANSNKPIYRSIFDTSHVEINATENSINSTTAMTEPPEKNTNEKSEGVEILRKRRRKRKVERKLNFPKKAKTAESESSIAPPKKTWRRGRKKKIVGASTDPVVKEEIIISGKRGRKKKILDFPMEEPKRLTTQKRGRKKVQDAEQSGIKRGRKAKIDPQNPTNKADWRFECEQCGRKTRYLCDYKRHLNVHLKTRLYECSVCQRYFKHQGSLYWHMKSKHDLPNLKISDMTKQKITIPTINEDNDETVKTCETVEVKYVHFLVDDEKTMLENTRENENPSGNIEKSNETENSIVDFDKNNKATRNSTESEGCMSESVSENEENMTENLRENGENEIQDSSESEENAGEDLNENSDDAIEDFSENAAKHSSENEGNVTGNSSENEENVTETSSENEENVTGNSSENEENVTGNSSENEENVTGNSNENEANVTEKSSEGENSKLKETSVKHLDANNSEPLNKKLRKVKVSSVKKNTKSQFTCDICGMHFLYQFRLISHKINLHSNINVKSKIENVKKDQTGRQSVLIGNDHISTIDDDQDTCCDEASIAAQKGAVRDETTPNASPNRNGRGRPCKISNAGSKKFMVRNFSQKFECALCGEFLESDLSLSSHKLLVHGLTVELEKLKNAAKLDENRMKNTIPPENIPQFRERGRPVTICGKIFAQPSDRKRNEEPHRHAFILCNLCNKSFQSKNRFMSHVLHHHPDMKEEEFGMAISVRLDHKFVQKVLPDGTMSAHEEQLPETSPTCVISNDLEELEETGSAATNEEDSERFEPNDSENESNLSSEIESVSDITSLISENDSQEEGEFRGDVNDYYCQDSDGNYSVFESDVVASSYKKRQQSFANNEGTVDSEKTNNSIETCVKKEREISTVVAVKKNSRVDTDSDQKGDSEIKNNQKDIISGDQKRSKETICRVETNKKVKMEIEDDVNVKEDKSMEEYENEELVRAENTDKGKKIVEKQQNVDNEGNEVNTANGGDENEGKESNPIKVGPRQSSEVSSSSGLGVVGRKEVHKCDICQMKFGTKSILQSHLYVHVRELQKCDACGRKFVSLEQLEAHLMAHLSRTYECAICGWKFLSVENLERHTREKHANNLQCSVCDRKFSDERVLARHLLTHNYVSAYPCSQCDKVFMHEHFLHMHELKHAKSQPFGCTICGMKFARVDNLKSHAATHKDKGGDVWEEIVNNASLDKEGGGADGGRLPNYVQIAEMFENFWVDNESSGSD